MREARVRGTRGKHGCLANTFRISSFNFIAIVRLYGICAVRCQCPQSKCPGVVQLAQALTGTTLASVHCSLTFASLEKRRA